MYLLSLFLQPIKIKYQQIMKIYDSVSKPRFDVLDGLRGVAALIVVVYHITEGYASSPLSHIPNHGYLAVDFFFLLSGYVVGYAYDGRWDTMGLRDFARRRLVRLHPMIVFGTLLGMLLFYFSDGHPSFKELSAVPWWLLVGVGLWCCTLIPVPGCLDIRGWADFNPLNGATWSLVWEYVGNVLYAVVFRHLSTLWLFVGTLLAGVLTLLLCFDIDVFGVFSARSAAAFTVIGGWNMQAEQLLIGITRLLYPFMMGLLLSRMGEKARLRGSFTLCALAVSALLIMPRVGGSVESHFWMNGLYEAVCILVLFPLIVLLGAGARTSGRRITWLCGFLGRISYPLYVVHLPIVFVQMSWAARHPEASAAEHTFVCVATLAIALAVAYAALVLYDEPLRKRLLRGKQEKQA